MPRSPPILTTAAACRALTEILRQLAAEVLAQHRAVVENQAQIEKKMETLAENLRLARIYASRGGKGGAK